MISQKYTHCRLIGENSTGGRVKIQAQQQQALCLYQDDSSIMPVSF